jgi:hypothetical protein
MKRNGGQWLLAMIILVQGVSSLAYSEQKRVLLVISELDHRGVQELAPLYRKIEDIAFVLPSQSYFISRVYSRILALRDQEVTIEGTKEFLLRTLSDESVDVVDVILGVHGRPDRLTFYDGSVNVSEWIEAFRSLVIRDAGEAGLAKLGLLYNLSCYGSSHIKSFLNLGFKTAVGSRKVNANAELEYPWVLQGLALGQTVESAFGRPNSKNWLKYADGPLRWLGKKLGNFLKETDSYKVIGGEAQYRIVGPN